MSTAKHTGAWRNKMKQNGLCPQCGRNPNRNGKRCEECLVDSTKYQRERFQDRYDTGFCVQCGKNPYEPGKKSCVPCSQKRRDKYVACENNVKEKRREQASLIRHECRKRVLKHYGSECICCGELEPMFLSLDHINGGGNEHRRQIGNNPNNRQGSSSTQFYKWVEKNDYPGTLQILCHNCNMGKHLNGGICPHQCRTVKTRYVYVGKGEPAKCDP